MVTIRLLPFHNRRVGRDSREISGFQGFFGA
jgi:hypothetical protein